MSSFSVEAVPPCIWQVGALCHAVSDALQARFNPLAVEGEISGFSRAGSGHCYFSLKDESGQLRCAMFQRAAMLLDFVPRDGDRVVVQGRLGVYESRGDLQMVVEAMRPVGEGALFARFARLKTALQQEGLFDADRKRPPRAMPRGVAVVTSPQAAALQDVLTTLARRSPHVPVLVVPALVQGVQAPASLVAALQQLYARIGAESLRRPDGLVLQIDTILLVRGGGSLEDLWAFNDEQLARTIVQSPVPLISGVGHETDFSIADFCADVRAPTPTAAAELVATSAQQALAVCQHLHERLAQASDRHLDGLQQRLDKATSRLARPAQGLALHHARLQQMQQAMRHHSLVRLAQWQNQWAQQDRQLPRSLNQAMDREQERLARAALRLEMLNPQKVLERGYAVVSDASGHAITDARLLHHGQPLQVRVAQGEFSVQVRKQSEMDW